MTSTFPGPDLGVRIAVPVHFEDLDSYGMVHHGRYAALFERGMMRWWVEQGDPGRAAVQGQGVVHVVRALDITFEAPITAVGDVLLDFWMAHVGRTSYTYAFRLLSADGATVHATGRRVQVNVDPVTRRPAPLSPLLLDIARLLRGTVAAVVAA